MLTTIIITKNEEKNIARAIKSVSFSDQIIVVDAQSTDQTVAIAQSLGAHVISRPWAGYGPQKNYGAQAASPGWLLYLDADEEIPPPLTREIITVTKKSTVDFYWLKVTTVFLGKPLNHLGGHNLRLFKKSSGRWNQNHVHEQVQRYQKRPQTTDFQVVSLDDNFSKILEHPLLHHSHPTINSYLKKMHHYTSLDAKQMTITQRHRSGRSINPTWWLPYHLAARQLIKLLFYRRGILDGRPGLIWCGLSSYYEWEMARKYLAIKSDPHHLDTTSVSNTDIN